MKRLMHSHGLGDTPAVDTTLIFPQEGASDTATLAAAAQASAAGQSDSLVGNLAQQYATATASTNSFLSWVQSNATLLTVGFGALGILIALGKRR